MPQKHCIISGRVQGVGFRYWTQKTAKHAGLTGWVKNLPDGTVELLAQGDETSLASFIDTLWKGPAFSRVAAVTCSDQSPDSAVTNETYNDFSIRY